MTGSSLGVGMRRREFIAGLGGASVWPLAVQAQQPVVMRRIGVMVSSPEADRSGRAQADALREGLRERGWTEGRNIRIDWYWDVAEAGRARTIAGDVVATQPDLIFSMATPATAAVVQLTKTIPIVFSNIADPVAQGFVASYTRPGGNVTGFNSFEPSMAGKWVEILHDLNPRIRWIKILFNPDTAPAGGKFFLPPFKAAGTALGIETIEAQVHNTSEVEQAIEASAGEMGGGLAAMPDTFTGSNRDFIARLALKHRLPLVAAYRVFSDVGGLVSYGPNTADLARRAASYVDRILKGEKPAELPIQAPTKFEMLINLGTAKALGLTVPPTLLAQADDVIE
jgi:putative tryptophan/tyrosine transport system substrate-binding protein